MGITNPPTLNTSSDVGLTCVRWAKDLIRASRSGQHKGMRNGRVETLTGGRQLIIIIFLRLYYTVAVHTSPSQLWYDLQMVLFSEKN